MDSVACGGRLPDGAVSGGSILQTRKPGQGRRDEAPVTQAHFERLVGHADIGDALVEFVNTKLLPYLRGLTGTGAHDPRDVLAAVFKETNNRMLSGYLLRDVVNKVNEINFASSDDIHTMAHLYESMLREMRDAAGDSGEFYTPRSVVRFMVAVMNPQLGEKILDPACGTGGFLVEAYSHLEKQCKTVEHRRILQEQSIFGGEAKSLPYMLCQMNLLLHGLDAPQITKGNSLEQKLTEIKDSDRVDVILTNPPFGGKEGKDAQKNFAFETSATQVLFVQDILAELAPGGTCAIVLDEGLLFRTNESAFVETKRKLLDECDLWAIVSLPGGVFSTAGAGVKTNLLFFTKGRRTERIWYYDLSWVKVGKKTPLTLAHFGFAPDGSVLDDAQLPAALMADWRADEANASQPFPSYARQLGRRGTAKADSRWSWTAEFDARRSKARADMQPLLDDASALRTEIVDLKDKVRRLKKDGTAVEFLQAHEAQIRKKDKAAHDLEVQAADIDAAVFDLKAVNPNTVATVDQRTSAQIIDSINAQGHIVAEALARLSALLASDARSIRN